jgi:hypothetical protein
MAETHKRPNKQDTQPQLLFPLQTQFPYRALRNQDKDSIRAHVQKRNKETYRYGVLGAGALLDGRIPFPGSRTAHFQLDDDGGEVEQDVDPDEGVADPEDEVAGSEGDEGAQHLEGDAGAEGGHEGQVEDCGFVVKLWTGF